MAANAIKNVLENTFGNEGIKTDVKITLPEETIFKFVIGVGASVAVGTLAYHLVKSIFR